MEILPRCELSHQPRKGGKVRNSHHSADTDRVKKAISTTLPVCAFTIRAYGRMGRYQSQPHHMWFHFYGESQPCAGAQGRPSQAEILVS